MEKKAVLDALEEALSSLMPEGRELAEKVFGEEMQVSKFARLKGESRTTVSSRKQRVVEKLRRFFRDKDFQIRK